MRAGGWLEMNLMVGRADATLERGLGFDCGRFRWIHHENGVRKVTANSVSNWESNSSFWGRLSLIFGAR